MAEKGQVQRLISDPGTQLKGAAAELANVRTGWSESELISFGAQHGLQWDFAMPAAHHQSGAVEIMVKLCKGVMRALTAAIGSTVLFLNEYFTLFKECSNLVNERPIGLKPNRATDQEFLSPNSLLLGRCSDRINSGPFQNKIDFGSDPNHDKTRFILVQKITDQFWNVWQKLYFPTLIRRQKWHHSQRNLKIGDIVSVRDSNAIRGEWRLARVSDVFPDNHGIVRNVELTLPPPSLLADKSAGKNYKAGFAMVKMKRHVNSVIVVEPNEDEEDVNQAGDEDLNDVEDCKNTTGGECKDDQDHI